MDKVGMIFAGRFELGERLHCGRTGEVYRARDLNLGGLACAVKIVPGSIFSSSGAAAVFPLEVQAARELSHPYILTPRVCGVEGDDFYFTTELFDGIALEERIKRGMLLAPEETVALLLGACSALHYLHSRRRVHGRLAAANLLIDPKLRLRLADPGIRYSALPAPPGGEAAEDVRALARVAAAAAAAPPRWLGALLDRLAAPPPGCPPDGGAALEAVYLAPPRFRRAAWLDSSPIGRGVRPLPQPFFAWDRMRALFGRRAAANTGAGGADAA